MTGERLLAIDQGTHSSRAVVYDLAGRQLALAREPIDLQRHSHTEIEQSAGQILDSVRHVIRRVLDDPAVRGSRICAAGLATQRSSVLGWDRHSGAPLSPVLSWQDTRSRGRIRSLGIDEAKLERVTGLRLSPHYGAGKLQWLREHNPAVQNAGNSGSLALGPLASFLLSNLLEQQPLLADHANASRTLLWNLEHRDWDKTLAGIFGVPLSQLPACRPICSVYGSLQDTGIPVTAVNGDQTAALYAAGQPDQDALLANIGTGAFVLLPTDAPSKRPAGLLAGISMSTGESADYYIEGTVNGAAAALSWLQEHLGASQEPGNLGHWLDSIDNPPLFINTVGGLGAPWWTPGPAPFFPGGTPGLPEASVAVCESIVFLLQRIIERMREFNPGLTRIRVSGGLSQLDGLCLRLASLSGLSVERPVLVEATARGIAWQAYGSLDNWQPDEPATVFTPTDDGKLKDRYRQFIDTLTTVLD